MNSTTQDLSGRSEGRPHSGVRSHAEVLETTRTEGVRDLVLSRTWSYGFQRAAMLSHSYGTMETQDMDVEAGRRGDQCHCMRGAHEMAQQHHRYERFWHDIPWTDIGLGVAMAMSWLVFVGTVYCLWSVDSGREDRPPVARSLHEGPFIHMERSGRIMLAEGRKNSLRTSKITSRRRNSRTLETSAAVKSGAIAGPRFISYHFHHLLRPFPRHLQRSPAEARCCIRWLSAR